MIDFQDVARCRNIYMRAKLFALERPNELLCIAIDGSDQSSYAYPYFKQVHTVFRVVRFFLTLPTSLIQAVTPRGALCGFGLERQLLFSSVIGRQYLVAQSFLRGCSNPTSIDSPDIQYVENSEHARLSVVSQKTKDKCKGWKVRLKLIRALCSGRLCRFFTIGSNWESGTYVHLLFSHSCSPCCFSHYSILVSNARGQKQNDNNRRIKTMGPTLTSRQ